MASALVAGRAALGTFFDWWLGELKGLVPARLRKAGRRDRPRLVLQSDGTRVALSTTGGGGDNLLESGSMADPAGQARLRGALRGRRRAGRTVTLRLEPGQGLRRQLELPLAAEGDLRSALRFEMDRITPFKADEVLFAHRVIGVDRDRRQVAIELDVVPRPVAERLFEVADDLGLDPQRLELTGPDGQPGHLDLLPREAEVAGRASRLNRLLLLLLIGLAAVAALLPLQRQQRAAQELAQEVEDARIEARESIRLRDELEAFDRSRGFVASARAATPMAASILAELTRVIPDQAYVTQLRLQSDELQIHGLADTASDLIGRLSGSPMFESPQFLSSVTRDPRAEKERFHIEVQIVGPTS